MNRAFESIKSGFAEICDRAVALDFTLEEDGYTPVFYGLEALSDALADLLPEAESSAIYQLLDQGAGEKIGTLYRDVARRYILAFSIMAATLAAVPLPFATMPVLTALTSLPGGIVRPTLRTDPHARPKRGESSVRSPVDLSPRQSGGN